MAVSYQSAVDHLYRLGHELAAAPVRKFDLANMRAVLGALGAPQLRFPSVLIAGTNGKGSTSATLYSILRAAGHRAALYTSPHLLRVNERIRVDGADISDVDFAGIYDRVSNVAAALVARGALPAMPSFFETLTAMAFEHFAASRVDIAVLEVGMGGRLDATNVVEPLVSVITDIALDHQKYLGDTLAEIAAEKAGIIRPGGVTVTLPQHPAANQVIGNAIMERGARAVSAVDYVPPLAPGSHARGLPRSQYPLAVLGQNIQVDSPLLGRHQWRNLALAIATAIELGKAGFPVSAGQIERGIRDTYWPGRFQILPATPTTAETVLDVAHNPAGAWALRSSLSNYYEGRPLILIFGAMRDKAISEMAEILFPIAPCVIATQADTPRSATPAEIRAAGARTGADVLPASTVAEALELARRQSAQLGQPAVVITGSIYVVGEALHMLQPRA